MGPLVRSCGRGFFLGSVLAAIDDPGPNSSTASDLVVTSFGSRSIGRFDGGNPRYRFMMVKTTPVLRLA